MRFYLNDSSLQGQFQNRLSDFKNSFFQLHELLMKNKNLRKIFFIVEGLGELKLNDTITVRDLINDVNESDTQRTIFWWIDKAGPFVDHFHLWNLKYKFVFEDLDVTNTGLGEACLQRLANYECAIYSFQAETLDFAKSPLSVYQVQENVFKNKIIEIKNLWKFEQLVTEATNLEPEVLTWTQMIEKARRIYPNLIIGNIEQHPNLSQSAFKVSIRDQCMKYMGFLNEIMSARNEHGTGSKNYQDLHKLYFRGDDPIFRDESTENKRKFKNELTFKRRNGQKYKAAWHSRKISQKFRLHFEWQNLKKNQKQIEIFYFGPKITKK